MTNLISKLLRRAACVILAGFSAWTTPADAAESYREPWRPQFHFTPATNWMNDPNWMVYYDGVNHIFYQFNPFANKCRHMSLGHAISHDIVHSAQLPIS